MHTKRKLKWQWRSQNDLTLFTLGMVGGCVWLIAGLIWMCTNWSTWGQGGPAPPWWAWPLTFGQCILAGLGYGTRWLIKHPPLRFELEPINPPDIREEYHDASNEN